VYKALDEMYLIIGVAKRSFHSNAEYVREVRREWKSAICICHRMWFGWSCGMHSKYARWLSYSYHFKGGR